MSFIYSFEYPKIICAKVYVLGFQNSSKLMILLARFMRRSWRWWQRMRGLDSTVNSVVMSLSKLWAIVKGREAWCAAVHGVTKSQMQQSNWTTRKGYFYNFKFHVISTKAYRILWPVHASCGILHIKNSISNFWNRLEKDWEILGKWGKIEPKLFLKVNFSCVCKFVKFFWNKIVYLYYSLAKNFLCIWNLLSVLGYMWGCHS